MIMKYRINNNRKNQKNHKILRVNSINQKGNYLQQDYLIFLKIFEKMIMNHKIKNHIFLRMIKYKIKNHKKNQKNLK